MTEAIKKIIEGIDSKNVSVVAENFSAAIKDKVLARIVAESAKAFDKGVEEIEGDEESSEADGEGDKDKKEDK